MYSLVALCFMSHGDAGYLDNSSKTIAGPTLNLVAHTK